MSETDAEVFMRLLDIATAFPSISRRAIFIILAALLPSSRWLVAVAFLYLDNYHDIMWRGKRYEGVWFEAGVKQGCPLSVALLKAGQLRRPCWQL